MTEIGLVAGCADHVLPVVVMTMGWWLAVYPTAAQSPGAGHETLRSCPGVPPAVTDQAPDA